MLIYISLTNIDMNDFEFKEFLILENLSPNTITSYVFAVRDFFARYGEVNKRNLIGYKNYLVDTYKPKSANPRIIALNRYLDFIGKSRLRMKTIREQQPSYLENVISNADYEFFKNSLKNEKKSNMVFCCPIPCHNRRKN